MTEVGQRHADPDMTVALYGSVVRGEVDSDSDLDLLVVWRSEPAAAEQTGILDELNQRLPRATGNPIETADLPVSDLQRMARASDPLVASWKREVKNLSNRPDLRPLLRAAA